MDILFGRDQFPVIISFFICGIFSGILFDLFKIKRRIFGANKMILFVDDFIFMLICATAVIFTAYAFNNGNMKWYEVPDMVAGFVVYRKTFSVVFIKICFFLIDKIKQFIKVIFLPIKKMLLAVVDSIHIFYLSIYTLLVKKHLSGTVLLK